LVGIALLLFFEDFKAGALEAEAFAAAPLAVATLLALALLAFALVWVLEAEALAAVALAAVRVSLAAVRERLLASRLAADARLAPFDETLVLRVFCDTACAWNRHAPVRCFLREPFPAANGMPELMNVLNIAHSPQKSMIYDDSCQSAANPRGSKRQQG
jgi:hypothetical protein